MCITEPKVGEELKFTVSALDRNLEDSVQIVVLEDPGLPNLADVADQTSYSYDPADGPPAATVVSREFSFRPEKHQAIPRGLKYRVCFQAKSSSTAGDETDASEARCVNIHVIQPDAVFDSCSGCASASSGPRLLNVEHYRSGADNFNEYDPEAWIPTLSLKITPFMLWPFVIVTSWSLFLTVYLMNVDDGLMEYFSLSFDAHSLLGGALAFLVVFRTNSSYDRWWAARNAWQSIINCCRILASTTAPALDCDEATDNMIMQIMAFVICLKCKLREEPISRLEVRLTSVFDRILDAHTVA